MSKHQLIDAIRSQNRTADHEFLGTFDHAQLESYLKRLTLIKDHRGRDSAWVREGDTMAIVTRSRRRRMAAPAA